MKHIEKDRVLKGVLAFSTAALMAVGLAPASMFTSSVYVSAEESAAVKLQAGKYTVTANTYVTAEQAPIGQTVYLGTNMFPPLVPAEQTGSMTVEENGDIYVTIPVEQELFTLQNVTDGEDIHVVSVKRGGKEKPYGPYEDRITSVTVKLDNTNGEYVFGSALEYPTLLEEDQTWDIHVNVDFSSAQLIPEAGYEGTVTDSDTGISVKVRAEAESSSIGSVMNGTLGVEPVSEGKEYSLAKTSLAYAYETLPTDFDYYKFSFTNNGEKIAHDELVKYTVSIPVDSENAAVYTTENGIAKAVEGEVEDGKFTFETTDLKDYIVVKNDDGTLYHYSRVFEADSVKGASIAVGVISTDTKDPLWDWGFYDFFESYVGDVKNIKDLKFNTLKVIKEEGKETTFEVIENETATNYWNKLDIDGDGARLAQGTGDFEKAEVQGIYAAAACFDQTYQGGSFFNPAAHTGWIAHNCDMVDTGDSSRADYLNMVEKVTLPVSSDNCSVYMISGTASTGMTDIKKLDAKVSGGFATVDVVNYDDLKTDVPDAALWNGAEGYDEIRDVNGKPYYNSNAGGISSFGDVANKFGWTDDTKIAYLMVVKEQDKAIAKPTAAEGLKYTGEEQIGVAEGEGYTLSGTPSATEPGSYTVTATLKDGYVWEDGTYDAINLVYTIAKVENVDVGVYTVTANLYCPGELNTQLPGVTAYLTNGNNPLGIGGYDKVAPTEPVYNNAELTVEADGTKYITVDILNPVFTLQEIGDCANAEIVELIRDDETYVSGVDSSVTREGRITKIKVKLLDDSGIYVFNKCTEFPTLLGVDWNVPLTLEVDFNGNKKPDDDKPTDPDDNKPTDPDDNKPSEPDETPSQPDETPSQPDETPSQSDDGSKADEEPSNSPADKTTSIADTSSNAANGNASDNPNTGARGLAFAGAAICGAFCMITGRKNRKDK